MELSKNNVINIYKPVGVTPLEMITKLKQKYPYYENMKMGYAGRLDPMAEGIMLILVDEENKKRKDYELLPKTYKVDIIFGISTDTYDGMGIITDSCTQLPVMKEVTSILSSFKGSFNQAYPPYSSTLVNGKPLYYWARNGKIDALVIPTKRITINDIKIVGNKMIKFAGLAADIISRVQRVTGEFRQSAIIDQWQQQDAKKNQSYLCVTIEVTCTSGTYMRSLAHEAGKKAGSGAFAYHIKRTKVGSYILEEALRLMP